MIEGCLAADQVQGMKNDFDLSYACLVPLVIWVQVPRKLGGLMSATQLEVKLKEGPLHGIFRGLHFGKLQLD